MSNLQTLKRRLAGTDALDDGGESTVNELTDFVDRYVKAADDAMASTATSDTRMRITYPYPVKISAVTYKADGTITASDTDYATITVKFDDGAAGSPVAAAQQTTKTSASGGSGNVAADVSITLPLVSTNAVIPAGGQLFLNIAKANSGVIVRAGTFTVRATRIGS